MDEVLDGVCVFVKGMCVRGSAVRQAKGDEKKKQCSRRRKFRHPKSLDLSVHGSINSKFNPADGRQVSRKCKLREAMHKYHRLSLPVFQQYKVERKPHANFEETPSIEKRSADAIHP